MGVKTNEYLSYILECLEPIGQVSVRAMFGGHGLYYRGVIFGIVAFDELYFKVGEANIMEYKAVNSSPFIYAGKHKPITMSYWRVPERVLEDEEKLERWVMAAYKVSCEKKKNA